MLWVLNGMRFLSDTADNAFFGRFGFQSKFVISNYEAVMTKRVARVSECQWEILLQYLERNPSLARGYNNSARGRAQAAEMWKEVANIVNAEGSGTTKTPKEWSVYVSNYKSRLKKTVADINTDHSRTGGGPPSQSSLSELDNRFLAILGPGFGQGAPQVCVNPFPVLQAHTSAATQDNIGEVFEVELISSIEERTQPAPMPSVAVEDPEPPVIPSNEERIPEVLSRRRRERRYGTARSPRITEQPSDTVLARGDPGSLRCAADGEPPPTLTWYKDGVPVAGGVGHRVQLKDQLLFLRVVPGKDGGVYWCEARNSIGRAVSRNATLTVAVLRDGFREEPKDTRVAAGDRAVLACSPPRGSPEPNVYWTKDGERVQTDGSTRLGIIESGSLLIRSAEPSDAGVYRCVAHNVADSKVSRGAALLVLRPPRLQQRPNDITTVVGKTVLLSCSTGTPLSATWLRDGGTKELPQTARLVSNGLRIEDVTMEDSGVYTCRAEGEAGKVEANATLTVYVPPTLTKVASDQTVWEGESASFPCEAEGKPPPILFWTMEGVQDILVAGASDRVTDTGMLRLEHTSRRHQGALVCAAISAAGAVTHSVQLQVLTKEESPPPIIDYGPTDQILPPKSFAEFICSARWASYIKWDKDGHSEIARVEGGRVYGGSGRFNVAVNGTLLIEDLQDADSGEYTCTAVSPQGTTALSSKLLVSSSPTTGYRRAPNVGSLPPAPPAPKPHNVSVTQVTLTWLKKPGYTYSIEYYSPSTKTKWMVAAENIDNEFYAVSNLEPDTLYRFGMRVKNDIGSSPLSEVTQSVLTKKQSSPHITQYELTEARKYLENDVIALKQIVGLSSTTLKVIWELLSEYDEYLEGIYIRYRPSDINSTEPSTSPKNFSCATVHNGASMSHLLTGLSPFTQYDIFLMPYYKMLQGKPSVLKTGMTEEDVPQAPPSAVTAGVINATSAWVKWAAPPSDKQGGVLTGYKIQIRASDTNKILGQMTLNSSTYSVIISSLALGKEYNARVGASTKKGTGNFSSPVPIVMDLKLVDTRKGMIRSDITQTGNMTDLLSAPWLAAFGLALIVLLISGAVLYARAKCGRRKQAVPSVQPLSPELCALKKEQHWRDDGDSWHPQHCDTDCQIKLLHGQYSVPVSSTRVDRTGDSEYAEVDLDQIAKSILEQGTLISGSSCTKSTASPESSHYANNPIPLEEQYTEPINNYQIIETPNSYHPQKYPKGYPRMCNMSNPCLPNRNEYFVFGNHYSDGSIIECGFDNRYGVRRNEYSSQHGRVLNSFSNERRYEKPPCNLYLPPPPAAACCCAPAPCDRCAIYQEATALAHRMPPTPSPPGSDHEWSQACEACDSRASYEGSRASCDSPVRFDDTQIIYNNGLEEQQFNSSLACLSVAASDRSCQDINETRSERSCPEMNHESNELGSESSSVDRRKIDSVIGRV